MICDICDPLTSSPTAATPATSPRKAEQYLRSTGIADISFWGPELEFFVFDDVRFDQAEQYGFYYIDSVEGEWNSGRDEKPNLGYKPRFKEGYFPVPPHDSMQDLRSEMILTMINVGIPIEVHHHEVATAGQAEIDMKFDSLVNMADKVMWYKYIVKNVARKHGKVATFMPKPLFGDNGSGMHTHMSLWKNGTNIFYDPEGYALISQTARYYIGGLLKHAPALMALCAPTTNSYKRLVPGYEAPVNLVYSAAQPQRCRAHPGVHLQPQDQAAGVPPARRNLQPLPGLLRHAHGRPGRNRERDRPGPPLDKNTYELSPEEERAVPTVPGSLEEALDALEEDHEFLSEGRVFTSDVLEVWLEYKREHEMDPVRLRPHPWEFYLYFDV